jgi:polyhydroxyalkanoate synthesis regulator phasin
MKLTTEDSLRSKLVNFVINAVNEGYSHTDVIRAIQNYESVITNSDIDSLKKRIRELENKYESCGDWGDGEG